jgi:hypothetical protein
MTEEERAILEQRRRQQQEAQQKKAKEEMALKRKKEMEERRRLQEERERIQQSKLRQSRETQDSKRAQHVNVIAKTLESGLEEDKKKGHVTEEVAKTYKEARVVAKEIEEALFAHHKEIGKEYLAFFRSLVFNVKDEKNFSLRSRIFTGELQPQDLVQMDSKDLANTEIMKYRAEKEKELFTEVFKRPEAEIVIRKTHKGIEVAEDVLESVGTSLPRKQEKEEVETSLEGNLAVPGVGLSSSMEASGLSTPPVTPLKASRDGNDLLDPFEGILKPFIHIHIPSHPIPSHPIPSHPIPSHPIPSHDQPIPSHCFVCC